MRRHADFVEHVLLAMGMFTALELVAFPWRLPPFGRDRLPVGR